MKGVGAESLGLYALSIAQLFPPRRVSALILRVVLGSPPAGLFSSERHFIALCLVTGAVSFP